MAETPTRPAVDIEIGVHRRDPSGFIVELRCDPSEEDGETNIVSASGVRIDMSRLRDLSLKPNDYWQTLTTALFGDGAIKEGFQAACARADERSADVRLRLLVGLTEDRVAAACRAAREARTLFLPETFLTKINTGYAGLSGQRLG